MQQIVNINSNNPNRKRGNKSTKSQKSFKMRVASPPAGTPIIVDDIVIISSDDEDDDRQRDTTTTTATLSFDPNKLRSMNFDDLLARREQFETEIDLKPPVLSTKSKHSESFENIGNFQLAYNETIARKSLTGKHKTSGNEENKILGHPIQSIDFTNWNVSIVSSTTKSPELDQSMFPINAKNWDSYEGIIHSPCTEYASEEFDEQIFEHQQFSPHVSYERLIEDELPPHAFNGTSYSQSTTSDIEDDGQAVVLTQEKEQNVVELNAVLQKRRKVDEVTSVANQQNYWLGQNGAGEIAKTSNASASAMIGENIGMNKSAEIQSTTSATTWASPDHHSRTLQNAYEKFRNGPKGLSRSPTKDKNRGQERNEKRRFESIIDNWENNENIDGKQEKCLFNRMNLNEVTNARSNVFRSNLGTQNESNLLPTKRRNGKESKGLHSSVLMPMPESTSQTENFLTDKTKTGKPPELTSSNTNFRSLRTSETLNMSPQIRRQRKVAEQFVARSNSLMHDNIESSHLTPPLNRITENMATKIASTNASIYRGTETAPDTMTAYKGHMHRQEFAQGSSTNEISHQKYSPDEKQPFSDFSARTGSRHQNSLGVVATLKQIDENTVSQSVPQALPPKTPSHTSQDFVPIKLESNIEDLLPYRKYFTLPLIDEVKHKWKVVTPWIENTPEQFNWAIKRNLRVETQLALFKCMHPTCIFSTNDGAKMRIHIKSHMDLIEALDRADELSPVVKDMQMRCRACPYCDIRKEIQIVEHIEVEHKQSIFQCANCFYRTIELENMVFHNEKYHPSTPAKSTRRILLCNDGKRCITDETMQLVLANLEDSSKLLKCGNCGYQCYYLDDFLGHLKSQHATHICGECGTSVQMDRFEQHLEAEHNIAEYQCIYCVDPIFGRNDIVEMKQHMADFHPDYFLFVAARRGKLNETDEQPIVVDISFISDPQITASYNVFKCPSNFDLNIMNPLLSSEQNNLQMLKRARENVGMILVDFPAIKPITYSDRNVFFISYAKYLLRRTINEAADVKLSKVTNALVNQ